MLRLELHPAPRWIDLMPGVRLQVAPMSTAIWLAAKSECPVATSADGSDVAAWSVDLLKTVARRVIMDWSGIGDLDGAPIPPSPGAISALLDRNDAWEAFNEQVFAPWYLLSAEKNGFAPSPDGTGARATIATAVPDHALPAQGGATPPEQPRDG